MEWQVGSQERSKSLKVFCPVRASTRTVNLIMCKLKVNALSEWIIGTYLHEFTNNERDISISHEALPSVVCKVSSSLFVNECC